MDMTRRQVIAAGAAGGAAMLVAGSSLVAAVPPPPVPTPPPAPLPPVPAAGRVAVDPIVNPHLLARARMAFDRHRHLIAHGDKVGITDFARASRDPRFFILDTATGQVSAHLVSHGRGSDPGHSGWLRSFSNVPGSLATSRGGYVTSEVYHGRYGRSMRLKGLDPSNSNAEDRAIVIHSAWYAEPGVAEQQGKLGRSEGCFAFSATSHERVMAALGPGRFLYADRIEA